MACVLMVSLKPLMTMYATYNSPCYDIWSGYVDKTVTQNLNFAFEYQLHIDNLTKPP